MAKSEIEEREQLAEDIFGEIQNYLIGKLPFGDEFNLLFNARNNIKRERLSRFFQSFREELEKVYGKPLDSDQITTEEFLDVMEAIMIKVQSTQSTNKVERFRNILLKQVIAPVEHQLTMKYIQLIDELTDVQMIMLSEIFDSYRVTRDSDIFYKIWKRYHSEMEDAKFDYKDFTIDDHGVVSLISRKDIRFYLFDLISKGLVNNEVDDELSIPNMKYTSWPTNSGQEVKVKRKKKELFTVTDFGKSLIDFVKTEAL